MPEFNFKLLGELRGRDGMLRVLVEHMDERAWVIIEEMEEEDGWLDINDLPYAIPGFGE